MNRTSQWGLRSPTTRQATNSSGLNPKTRSHLLISSPFAIAAPVAEEADDDGPFAFELVAEAEARDWAMFRAKTVRIILTKLLSWPNFLPLRTPVGATTSRKMSMTLAARDLEESIGTASSSLLWRSVDENAFWAQGFPTSILYKRLTNAACAISISDLLLINFLWQAAPRVIFNFMTYVWWRFYD